MRSWRTGPAQTAAEASTCPPVAQGSHGVGQRLAIGVVEVHSDRVDPHSAGVQGLEEPADVTGRTHPDGVAQRQRLVAPRSMSRTATSTDLLDRHRPLRGCSETHRDIGAHPQTGRLARGHDGGEHGHRLGDGPVEVLAGRTSRWRCRRWRWRRLRPRARRRAPARSGPARGGARRAPGHPARPAPSGRPRAAAPTPRARTRWSRSCPGRPPPADG